MKLINIKQIVLLILMNNVYMNLASATITTESVSCYEQVCVGDKLNIIQSSYAIPYRDSILDDEKYANCKSTVLDLMPTGMRTVRYQLEKRVVEIILSTKEGDPAKKRALLKIDFNDPEYTNYSKEFTINPRPILGEYFREQVAEKLLACKGLPLHKYLPSADDGIIELLYSDELVQVSNTLDQLVARANETSQEHYIEVDRTHPVNTIRDNGFIEGVKVKTGFVAADVVYFNEKYIHRPNQDLVPYKTVIDVQNMYESVFRHFSQQHKPPLRLNADGLEYHFRLDQTESLEVNGEQVISAGNDHPKRMLMVKTYVNSFKYLLSGCGQAKRIGCVGDDVEKAIELTSFGMNKFKSETSVSLRVHAVLVPSFLDRSLTSSLFRKENLENQEDGVVQINSEGFYDEYEPVIYSVQEETSFLSDQPGFASVDLNVGDLILRTEKGIFNLLKIAN